MNVFPSKGDALLDLNPDYNDILDIHKYLMKRTRYKIMFGVIKKIFNVLLRNAFNGSNHAKCVLLTNQKCITQPTLINLHPSEYSQEFHYFPFAVKLDRRAGSCNTLNDLSNTVCVPNKTGDLNLSVFNIITGINKSKTLTKHISSECKCKFDGRKCNSDQWWNKDKYPCECKKRRACGKDYAWNPAIRSCENGKYLPSTMDESAIICDKVIDELVTKNQFFWKKKVTCKTQNLLPFHFTNNKLKEIKY